MPSLVTDEMDDRYGRSRNRSVDRRIVFGTIGAVVVGVILWALFSGWGGNSVSVTAETTGFSINGSEVSVDYQVSGPPNSEIACAVATMSRSKAVVGWKVTVHEPSAKLTRYFTEQVIAIREPNTGYVERCWVVEAE